MASAKWMRFGIFLFFFSAVVQTVNSERRQGQARCRGNRKPQPCEELYTVDKDGCCWPCKCHKGRGRPRGAKNPCAEECQKCKRGRTYNDKFDFFCKPCQGCYDNRIVEQQCTRKRNRKCGEGCKPGYYRRVTKSQELEDNCVPCTKDSMAIHICNLYFNSPLNRSTTRASPSTIRTNYPNSNIKGTDLDIKEDAATSMTVFKTETTATMLNYTTAVELKSSEPTSTPGPNPEVGNHSEKSNSSQNGPKESKEEGMMNSIKIVWWYMLCWLLTSYGAAVFIGVNVVLFICCKRKITNPSQLLRELFTGRTTGAVETADGIVSDELKVDTDEQDTLSRVDTQPSDPNGVGGCDTGPDEGDRVTHSYEEAHTLKGAIVGASYSEDSYGSPQSAAPFAGTLSYSNNRGDFTGDTTLHDQNTQNLLQTSSTTRLKQIRKPIGTLPEAQPLLGPAIPSGNNNKLNLSENNQARVNLQLSLDLQAQTRGMRVTYESAADHTNTDDDDDDDDLHFGITADDRDFVQAQQAQEDLEQKENTEQKTIA